MHFTPTPITLLSIISRFILWFEHLQKSASDIDKVRVAHGVLVSEYSIYYLLCLARTLKLY